MRQTCQTLKKTGKAFSHVTTYHSLTEVLTDRGLASLGDAYINFVYSLSLSNRKLKPLGRKVKGTVLAQALKKAGLREYLPSRMDSHALADAAEALLVYAWLQDCITLEESVAALERSDDTVEGLTQLLTAIRRKVKLF